ncbi:MAG: class II aldolase/adducin family protein [Ktedonobacterales bacterium]|nr:class II aldolase/adducin family protein [Ktedonobacterales bacterium]
MGLSHAALRDQLVQAARRLKESNVLSHSGHGNMSVRLPESGQMLLTSVSHLNGLTPEDLVVVTFDGEVIEGNLDPTTREIVGMHSGVYLKRPDVQAVIHTHSPRTTTFALAHASLPCVYEAFLRFGITADIPVADWAPRGSAEAVAFIQDQLERHPTVPAVLLANHGVLAFSQDILAAAQLIIIMEESAEMTLDARNLGGEKGFPPGAVERERAHMEQFGSTQQPFSEQRGPTA